MEREILLQDPAARAYYLSLPLDARLALARRPEGFSSAQELRQCAETLFRLGGTTAAP